VASRRLAHSCWAAAAHRTGPGSCIAGGIAGGIAARTWFLCPVLPVLASDRVLKQIVEGIGAKHLHTSRDCVQHFTQK